MLLARNSWKKIKKRAIFKIHESVDKVSSKKKNKKTLFLVHEYMDNMNSYWISSTKSADSSTKSANKLWKAQREVVSNKAQRGGEEEKCD